MWLTRPFLGKMELYVQIPFGKLQSTKSINKLELTHIDRYLNHS